MTIQIMLGDCIEQMRRIPDGSIDLVLTDPPYGTTACAWDAVIPFEPMWAHVRRVLKPNGAAVLTATQPFSSVLGASNPSQLRYSWVWHKPHTGQLNAKRMPLKNVEDVLVFYDKQPTYNPQYGTGAPYTVRRNGYRGSECYGAQVDHTTVSDGKRYPKQDLHFSNRTPGGNVHPTQKPVALMEYLIRTYTNPEETVLDFTMGSGTTGVACITTGRKFIGIERDEGYFHIACDRLAATIAKQVKL